MIDFHARQVGWLLAALLGTAACEPGLDPSETNGAKAALAVAAPVHRMAASHLFDREKNAAEPAQREGAFFQSPASDDQGMQSCVGRCGGLPFCETMCFLQEPAAGPRTQIERKVDHDCLVCGRETGFLPQPVEVSAEIEGAGVQVRWNPIEEAEQYELIVSRQKGANEPFEQYADETVAGTEWRFSVLPPSYTYVFSVTPYLDGVLAPERTGTSSPLEL